MKALVETTADFQLLMDDGTLIRHEGYTLITKSEFVHARAAIGQVRTVAEVNDEATDDEWQKYVAESGDDLELAVSSFVSSFPVERKQQTSSSKASEKPDTKSNNKKPASRQE